MTQFILAVHFLLIFLSFGLIYGYNIRPMPLSVCKSISRPRIHDKTDQIIGKLYMNHCDRTIATASSSFQSISNRLPIDVSINLNPHRYRPFSSRLMATSSRIYGDMNKNLKRIILFDGVCNFCNKGVDILASLDRDNQFTFLALQSEKGKDLLEKIGKDRSYLSSIVLLDLEETKDKTNIKSFAIKSEVFLEILRSLNGGFRGLGFIGSFIPLPIRDSLYDVIANNRYSFMGKREECRCGEFQSGTNPKSSGIRAHNH